jgi:hypothetical protein
MALSLSFLVFVGGRHSQCLGPLSTLGSFGPFHQRHHKSRVSLRGLPCALGVLGTNHGEVDNNHLHQTKLISSSTILLVGTPILKLPSSMMRYCIFLRARPSQCISKFGIVLNISVLGGLLAILQLSCNDLTYTKPTYYGTHLGCPSFGITLARLH